MFEHVNVLFFPEIPHLLDDFAKRFHVQVVIPFEKIPHGLHVVFLSHPLAVRIVLFGDVLVFSKTIKLQALMVLPLNFIDHSGML